MNTEDIPTRIRPAVDLMLEAFGYAQQTNSNVWDFSVDFSQLTKLGLIANDFRWLVRQGMVEHQREITLPGQNGRRFRPAGDMQFAQDSCFVLTPNAIVVLGHTTHSEESGDAQSLTHARSRDECSPADDTLPTVHSGTTLPAITSAEPHWDGARHELRIGGFLVKRFKWPARNQETILAVFQEQDWPPRIDDPLTPGWEQDPRRRLNDTIKCLNRKQVNRLLRFRGDGSGEGVLWENTGLPSPGIIQVGAGRTAIDRRGLASNSRGSTRNGKPGR